MNEASHSEAAAEAIRRIRQFGDDYAAMTRELLKFAESRTADWPGAAGAPPAGALDMLRAMLKEKFEHMYLPVVGPLQAGQQAGERLLTTTLRWQRASARMSELLGAVATDAVDRLTSALAGQDAPPVKSLRELHDLYVECGERAYAAIAHGNDYAAAQAELLMAVVEMRAEQRRAVEEWARSLNLPTRTEIDAIYRRLHALNRSLRESGK